MRDEDVELYEKYADELVRFATVLVGPSGAEDLLLDTVATVFTSPRWPSVANKRAYLYRALYNRAANERRATQRRLAREVRAAAEAPATLDPPLVDVDVLVALRHLTVRQRAVVHLRYWHDLAAPDVARALDVSLRTVERELAAAQRFLQEHLS